jgi:hypothetical protein
MLRAAHGQPGHDVPRPETAPNRCRVVGAITEHTVRPPPRSPAFAVQGWDRIYQGQASCESFRFAPVKRTARGMPRPSQIT